MVSHLVRPDVRVASQRSQQRPEGAQGDMGGSGVGKRASVDVLDGEAAAQDLDEDLPELSGGQVVQERIDDRAEVEEGVGHRLENHVAVEERGGPAGLGQRRHHNATDLHGQPAQHQGGHNQTWKKHPVVSIFTVRLKKLSHSAQTGSEKQKFTNTAIAEWQEHHWEVGRYPVTLAASLAAAPDGDS